jgi:hypothetical protein
MYGSRKKDGQLYSLTKIYDYENAELNLPDKSKFVKMFSIQQKIWDEENAHAYLEHIDDEFIETEYKKCDRYNGVQKSQPTEFHVSENKEDEIRRATYFVSLLDDQRAKDFDSWMRVGWALHNVDISLISVWIEFSKRSNKFKNGECEKVWYKMRDEGLTIRSLMLWAEQDNYTKYHQFINMEFTDVLNKSLDGSSYFVAKALHSKYMDRFVCASFRSGMWYEFRNHRWYSVAKGYTLQKEISEAFANEYYKLISKHSVKITQLNGSERDDAEKKLEKIRYITKQLMNITFKDKIMREAENLFHDPDFEQKLDENYDLIGFNNGVYDLGKEEFREGRPDDYISQSTDAEEDMPIFTFGFSIDRTDIPEKVFKHLERSNLKIVNMGNYWRYDNAILDAAPLYMISKNGLFLFTNDEDLAINHSQGYGDKSISHSNIKKAMNSNLIYASVDVGTSLTLFPVDLLGAKENQLIESLRGKTGIIELKTTKAKKKNANMQLVYSDFSDDQTGKHLLDLINAIYVASK